MEINDYLLKHTIVKIGNGIPGYVCCETIVDDPIELISVVMENECYISEIRWWDLVPISEGSTIGYGGARDPRAPDTMFFAETDICTEFYGTSEYEDYCSYLEQIKCNYSNHNLFPAFCIKKKVVDSKP